MSAHRGILRRIDFACNGDGGYFEGRVRMMDFAGALTLEGDLYGRGYAFAVDWQAMTLRLHRKTFRFKATRGGGNWHWEGFMFEPLEAKRLLRHVKASRKWQIDSGFTKLCDWFGRDAA